MKSEITANLVSKFLGTQVIKIIGDKNRLVCSLAKLDEDAASDSLSFCSLKIGDAIKKIDISTSGTILCSYFDGIEKIESSNRTLIIVENPRLCFIRISNAFFSPTKPKGIHRTALIEEGVVVGENVFIGPYTQIGSNCKIGDNSIIYGNVCLYSNVSIGNNVTIHSGTVIGATGFGYEINNSGEYERFPHFGGVIVQDNVDIGANSCIDRGSLGDTVIGKGTKIDNLVHIAHNVRIGENCLVIAHAMLAGSTQLGDRVWIAPCASVLEKRRIGEGAFVGIGAVVVNDVEDGKTVVGAPAREINDFKKLLGIFEQLLK